MRSVAYFLLVLAVSFVSFGDNPKEARFLDEYATVWFKRGDSLLFDNTNKGDIPPLSGVCDGVPKLDYLTNETIPMGEEKEDLLYRLYDRVGRWSVRTLHIWGYEDIETDDCKFVLGWGTAFVLALIKDKLIWATVDHNVNTRVYFKNTVATNWFIKDEEGNWKELLLLGCKKGKYCLLVSGNMSLLPINLFDDDYITNDLKLFDNTYLFGCSLIPERVKYLVHYRLHFFCLGSRGMVISRHSLPFNIGGDVLVSNPATSGFSGSPVLVWRDRWELVGVVNSGIEGVFTAVQFVDENIIKAIKEWFSIDIFSPPKD